MPKAFWPQAIFFGLIVLAPFFILAASSLSAGFLQGGIWYSQDPFFAGDTVRVYAAVFNSSGDDIKGTVEFLDNKQSIGTSDFFVERGGKFSQVWTDWNVLKGDHLVEAVITKASRISIGGSEIPIALQQQKIQESLRHVEQNTELPVASNSTVQTKTAAQKQNTKNFNITDTIIASLPDMIQKPASQINTAAKDTFAPVQALVDQKKQEAQLHLETLQQDQKASSAAKTTASLYLASLSAASFMLKTEIVLYVLALFFGYLLLKLLLRRVFRR